MQKILRSGRLALLALASLAACDGGTSVPRPATVSATSPVTQEAAAGVAVPEPPEVRVLDGQGRGLAGIGVTFAVTGGGGSVGTALATTDANGVASAGSWILGTGFGTNTVTATVADLPPVTFTAVGRDPCEVLTPYVLLTSLQAAIATRDCRLGNGTYADLYGVTVAATRGLTFSMTSTAVDAYLLLADAGGNLLGTHDDVAAGNTNSALRIFLPAGSYLLAATTYYEGETGAYTLTSSDLPANTGCRDPWVVPGVQLAQEITTADCLYDGYHSDDYLIVLRAGERVRIGMSSSAVDAYIGVWTGEGLIAEDDNGGTGTDALLDFTAPSFGAYLIEAGTAAPGQTGAYTLSVTSPGGGAAAGGAAPLSTAEVRRALGARAKGRPEHRGSPERRRP